VLLAAASARDIRLGHRVTAVEVTDVRNEVTFGHDRAAGSAHADLVVNADGIWSAVRSQLFC
jgi:2-polyprenyl-6-methoxyphenol hydroxylase-like FAD-dependent oxidoreductase